MPGISEAFEFIVEQTEAVQAAIDAGDEAAAQALIDTAIDQEFYGLAADLIEKCRVAGIVIDEKRRRLR